MISSDSTEHSSCMAPDRAFRRLLELQIAMWSQVEQQIIHINMTISSKAHRHPQGLWWQHRPQSSTQTPTRSGRWSQEWSLASGDTVGSWHQHGIQTSTWLQAAAQTVHICMSSVITSATDVNLAPNRMQPASPSTSLYN